jgi:uncharacterized membrane protein
MFKDKKRLIVLSSISCLLPILYGIFLLDKLPTKVPIHFGANGADGFASKWITVFGVPFLLLATHLLSIFLSSLDPKSKEIKGAPLYFIIWCIPVISNITMTFLYLNAINIKFDMVVLLTLMLGIIFVLISMFAFTDVPNKVIGIKLPWTVNNEIIWKKTHKLARIVWFICGGILILNTFIKSYILIVIISCIMIFIPITYSYIISRK